MEPVIEINDLNFKKISNFNLKIKKGTFMTILGSNESGILLISSLLCGINKDENVKCAENINILGVFSENQSPFFTNNVMDELKLSATKFKGCAEERINNIVDLFDINHLLNKKINRLNTSEKQILSIACTVLMNPDVIVIDNCILNIDPFYRKKVLEGLKQVNKNFKITIVNITNDSNQALFGSEIAIINNGKLVVCNKKMKVLKDENIFLNNNLKVPFMLDLSVKLKYYGLVDKIVLKQEKLVSEIWK